MDGLMAETRRREPASSHTHLPGLGPDGTVTKCKIRLNFVKQAAQDQKLLAQSITFMDSPAEVETKTKVRRVKTPTIH